MSPRVHAALIAFVLLAPSLAHAQAEAIPFDIVENVVIARGMLNGQAAVWIVDTGANITVVTPDAARRARVVASSKMGSASVAVGGVRVPDVSVMVDDPEVAHFVREAGIEYTGIIGTSFLDRFVVTFDYPARRLSFEPPETPGRTGSLDFEMRNGLMVVKAAAGGVPLRLLLDTGAAMTVIRPAAARRLGLRSEPSPGREDVRLGRLEALTVGDASRRGVEVAVHEPPQAEQIERAGLECDGFLGYTFLSDFRVSVDYKRRRVAIEVPRPVVPAPAPPLGLSLDETRVSEVKTGSAAAKAGFAVGDVIVSIGGQDVRYVEEIRGILGARRGSQFTVVVRRGERNVTLNLVW